MSRHTCSRPGCETLAVLQAEGEIWCVPHAPAKEASESAESAVPVRRATTGWVRPEDALPPERDVVLVMMAVGGGGISGPHTAWLRIHSDGPFFVIPAMQGRNWDPLPLVWRALRYDEDAARGVARAAAASRETAAGKGVPQ